MCTWHVKYTRMHVSVCFKIFFVFTRSDMMQQFDNHANGFSSQSWNKLITCNHEKALQQDSNCPLANRACGGGGGGREAGLT